MLPQKQQLSRSSSPVFAPNKLLITAKEDFIQVYEGLYKTVQNNSKTKFTPLIDFSKHKKQVDRKIKVIAKYLESDQMLKNELVRLPCLTPSVRETIKQDRSKSKSTKLQVQRLAVNNQTFYIQQKLVSPFCRSDEQINIKIQRPACKPFRSILSQKSKQLIYLSKRSVVDKVQSQQKSIPKYKDNTTPKKSLVLNPQQISLQLQKNKLIQTILEVDEKHFKNKKQTLQLQNSHKSVLNFPLMHEEMVGNSKPFQIESSPKIQKKTKMKSIQKTYALKEQFRGKNSFGIRKINWKTTPLPLNKVEKSSVNKIFLRYLGIQNLVPPVLGSYKFLLGEGNNSQLIRQALKSRGYWTEVDSLNQKPNFVWTQFPCQEFYKQETKIEKSTQTQKSTQEYCSLRQFQNKQFLKYHQNDYIKACKKLLPNKVFDQLLGQIVANFKNGAKLNNFEEIDRVTKIYINQRKTISLNNVSFVKVQSENDKQQKEGFKSVQFKLQNHIKNSKIIGDKKGLFNLFLEYCESNNQNINDFIPPTLHVVLGQKFDQDSVLFLIEDELGAGPWLIKPGQDTNRGHGIKIMQSRDELMRQIKKRNDEYLQKKQTNKQKVVRQQTLIIQKYIQPLLFEGRKFDIRMWAIWAKNQLWWYKEGYIRTSSKYFNLQSNSRFVHLTNDAVQINNEDYGKHEPANKISFAEFERYLEKQNQQSPNVPKQQFSQIYRQMKELTIKLFNICRGKLFEDTFNFELFGLDFLVGKDMKVWLIECNTNPSLEVHCSLQSRLVPSLIQNLLSIVIDPLFQCPQKRIGKEHLNTHWNQEIFKCEILIDGDQDQI